MNARRLDARRLALCLALGALLSAAAFGQQKPTREPTEPAKARPIAGGAAGKPGQTDNASAPARNQASADETVEERLAREGQVEALERRSGGMPETDHLRLLAAAQANKAARLRDGAEREKAFASAEQRYRKWIEAIGRAASIDAAQRPVEQAAAHAALANMLLSRWAGPYLDELEISDGARGDRERLKKLLESARDEFERARALLTPLQKQIDDGGYEAEEKLLALGVFDTIRATALDAEFSLGWTHLFLAAALPAGESRNAALAVAESKFSGLIDGGAAGASIYRCYLGLGIAARELGKLGDAERAFTQASEPGIEPVLEAQIAYELSRLRLKQQRFDDARAAIRKFCELDANNLPPELRGARLYVNLAQLWEANSHLLESAHLRQATDPARRAAARLNAQRSRETGLILMHRLAQRGGPWPQIVQGFVMNAVDAKADVNTLSALELLFSARALAAAERHDEALQRLSQAVEREDASKDLKAEILNELGLTAYRRGEMRRAADAFARVARDHRGHPLARQAVTYAYQLWAKLAEESKQPQDYQRLADVLSVLVESFPEHEKRDEAAWWLPVALQAAGKHAQAASEFAKIDSDSPRWEEAQFRRLLALRQDLDAERASLPAAQVLTRTRQLAGELEQYSARAAQRGAAERRTRLTEWAAAAAVEAAELWTAQHVERHEAALQAVADFEKRFPESASAGRVLALRIRAYRGLRQFELAAQAVEQYLKSTPPDKAGALLLSLARGMQEEVDRLAQRGESAAAGKLAGESVGTFEQLLKWVLADEERGVAAEPVRQGLAQMLYLAGRLDEARTQVDALLAADARNGNAVRLRALIEFAALPEPAGPAALAAARQAWEAILRDPGIRSSAPQRYWEARFHWLELTLREGNAAQVAQAIRQDAIWNPELGGPSWREKLQALASRAAQAAPPATTSSSAPAEP